MIEHITWIGDPRKGHLRLLDQTKLPGETVNLDCTTVQDVWDAIKRLSVRGAPAIGIAAAYGCVIGVQKVQEMDAHATGSEGVRHALEVAATYLAKSRPTAVNLFWALDRMRRVEPCTPERLLEEARRIHEEDAAMCRKIGEYALGIMEGLRVGHPRAESGANGVGVLTHCNAGALATGGIGTATAGMYLAHERGLPLRVFADETRPLLQGARLTAWELGQAGIDVTLVCDSMAAQVMREGKVAMVIVGADRIAANGDAANKIGTYGVAIHAKHHGIPFYVAAPCSTFDLSLKTGGLIPIEERAAEEITLGFGKRTAPEAVKTYSPAFDVTPASLITAIITDKGVIEPVDEANVQRVVGG
ncbi:MAG: S-methyl-5-thioribose-1-phosphate isomerase [Phycisphaera sp.]|nr:S-methyl-5-thioribose-1-phosphate isomerase [Phycisphaera sp.]